MMINPEVRFITDCEERGKIVLCFKHAVQAAVAGESVEVEIDEFGGPGDMRTTHCKLCHERSA